MTNPLLATTQNIKQNWHKYWQVFNIDTLDFCEACLLASKQAMKTHHMNSKIAMMFDSPNKKELEFIEFPDKLFDTNINDVYLFYDSKYGNVETMDIVGLKLPLISNGFFITTVATLHTLSLMKYSYIPEFIPAKYHFIYYLIKSQFSFASLST